MKKKEPEPDILAKKRDESLIMKYRYSTKQEQRGILKGFLVAFVLGSVFSISLSFWFDYYKLYSLGQSYIIGLIGTLLTIALLIYFIKGCWFDWEFLEHKEVKNE